MSPSYSDRKFACPHCSKVMALTETEYFQRRFACPYCFAGGAIVQPTYQELKFPCPQCRKVMILTPRELAEQRYDCPYCNVAGSLSDSPSPEPANPPTPETTSPILCDSDAREYRYERGHRVYLDGAPPPPDEAKARAEQSIEEARKWEELQARFKGTAERRKRLEDRCPKPTGTSEDKPEQSAEPAEPEDDPIPTDADWDVSFDDLDSEYWEWFYDRRQSLSFGELPEHYERDKDE